MKSESPRQDQSPPPAPAGGGGCALVLSGGGARAAYQVGVLGGIAERFGGDFPFAIITGVSSGAINASFLASHHGDLPRSVAELQRAWLEMSVASVFRPGPFSLLRGGVRFGLGLLTGSGMSLFQSRGILDTRPLQRTLSRHVSTENIERNLVQGRIRALGLSATSYSTGRTVTFVHGSGDISPLSNWRRAGRIGIPARITVEHVMASSALPVLFPAAAVGDEFFGDGSIRQSAPLAPAVHLGARGILAISLRAALENRPEVVPGYPPQAQVMGMLLNAVFLDALEADGERLLRVNRSLAQIPQTTSSRDGLRPIHLFTLRPSRDLGQLSADLGHHLPGTIRSLLRGLGSSRLKSPDLLSYLLFERPYIERLLELGRADALAQWDRIAPLVEIPA